MMVCLRGPWDRRTWEAFFNLFSLVLHWVWMRDSSIGIPMDSGADYLCEQALQVVVSDFMELKLFDMKELHTQAA